MNLVFQSPKTYEFLGIPTYDESFADLRRQAPGFPNIRQRSKEQISSFYIGTDKRNIITFVSPSGTSPGKNWTQRLQMLDLPKLIKKFKGKKTPREIVNLAVKGDIKVFCNDPSFLYWGWKYKAFVNGYGLLKETRFPKIRNPQLKGTTCKHLDNALLTLPFHVGDITRDLKKLGKFEEEKVIKKKPKKK